jgi:co-chaperonin GroES (HSP10)
MLQALGKNILVKPIEEEKKEKVILFLNEKKPSCYRVLSVGDDIKNISVDDTIFIHSYGMHEIYYENEKLFIVQMDNVYAKMCKV